MFKHGDARLGKVTRLHNIWRGMFKRCYAKNAYAYDSYGGRGIFICQEWHEFVKFKAWAKKSGYSDFLTIDRIDNDKGYSPENCRWATRTMQARNRKSSKFITFSGKTQTQAAWAEEIGMSQCRLYARLNKLGWSVQRSLMTP